MSGYLSQIAASLLISVIIAYAAYIPLSLGQLNLGIAGYMCIGAYASAVASAQLHWSIPLCIGAGVACAAIAGFLVAASVARMQEHYFSLATFAFAEVVTAVIINFKALGGAGGYVVSGYIDLSIIAAIAALVVGAVLFLMASRLGLTFTAIRNDERAAAVFGVSVPWSKVTASIIGAGLAGLGGALYGHHYSYIEAQNFNFLLSANAVLFVLLGGVQTAWGPLLGASVITLVPELLRASGEWRYIGFGAIMIVLMVLRPEGLLTRSLIRRLRHA